MTITASAKYLKVCNKTIGRLVKQGKLRKLADGGINSEDLEIVKLEFEERKRLGSPMWIKTGN